MPSSVFEPYQRKNYPHVFVGAMHLDTIAGGQPRDFDALMAHLARQTGITQKELVNDEVVRLRQEEGLTAEQALEMLAETKHLTGFRRDENGLYIGGYQLKACLKEASNIACNEGRLAHKGWGVLSAEGRGLKSWFPEHVHVLDHRLHFGLDEPTEVQRSFIHKKWKGKEINAIQDTEVIIDGDLTFTIETDHDFKDEEWAAIWTTAERMGLGSNKPMGYGTFTMMKWEKMAAAKTTRRLKAA